VTDFTDEDVTAAQAVIVETGALAEMESLIDTLTDQALSALEAAPIVDVARVELRALAAYVSQRSL
jgi:geranylgeranyl diphosphate synthase type I